MFIGEAIQKVLEISPLTFDESQGRIKCVRARIGNCELTVHPVWGWASNAPVGRICVVHRVSEKRRLVYEFSDLGKAIGFAVNLHRGSELELNLAN